MPPGPGRDDCRPGEPGGAAWAHIQCAPTAGNGSKRVCRGGLYIRPGKPAIPTAPPSNGVGQHAHMPPWPGCVARKPRGSGGAARTRNARPYAGWSHRTRARNRNRSGRAYSPPLRENRRRVRRGGLYGRPKTPAIPTAPPPNAVGRHAHMPPGPGRDDCRPGEPGGAAWAHIQCAPTAGNGSKRVCRGGLYIRPGKPAIPTAPPANGVGRHAHMPPGPGYDTREPHDSSGAVRTRDARPYAGRNR